MPGEYVYNPVCICAWCANGGTVPTGTPSNGHSFGYEQPHTPPHRKTMARFPCIDQTAVIGHVPEHRDFYDMHDRDPGLRPEIHSAARIEAHVTVDAGIDRPTRIGARTWLMKKVHVGHDAQVGDDCDLAPLSNIGGYAQIGNNVKIGMSAVILPYRTIGNGARIGAGAVVTKDVPAGETWIGNPARKLEDYERDERPHSERAVRHAA